MSRRGATRAIALVAVALLAALAPLALAGKGKRMQSTKIGPKLCETTGGGKFVDIPGFPGEKIDRRLLNDVRYLTKRYKIFVTDGYSTSDVHAWNGEHPIGLALDIVPDKAAGGRWSDIDRLARWAERRQDRPREPFRWVGYDGDTGHGRGHHLHLSWNHSMVKPNRPAATVYSIRCPQTNGTTGGGQPQPEPEPEPPPTGGSTAGDGGGGKPSGGIGGRRVAGVVAETGGVDGP